MSGLLCKVFLLLALICLVAAAPAPAPQPQDAALGEATPEILDIKVPEEFNYESPLAQPDSLRSQPYLDFLTELYKKDSDKTALLQSGK